MSVYSGIMSQYSSNDVAALADGFNWKHSYPCISKQKENYSKYVCVCVCVCVYVRETSHFRLVYLYTGYKPFTNGWWGSGDVEQPKFDLPGNYTC